MIALLQTLRALTAAVLSFTLVYYFDLPQGYWLILIAMLLSQVQINAVLLRNLLLVLFCGVGIVLHVTVANVLARHAILLPLYLCVTTCGLVYVGLLKTEFFRGVFIIILAGIVSAGVPVANELMLLRAEAVLWGVVVSIILLILFFPRNLVKQQYIDTLENLNQLQKKTFLIYGKRDYKQKHFVYEKELHQLREKVLIDLQLEQQDTLQSMFEITITLGELRYRVEDVATFEVCEKEFKRVSEMMSFVLHNLIKKLRGKKIPDIGLEQFATAIESVEAIYRSTLQVVSKEPMVFLVFIQNLFALYDAFNAFSDEVEKI